MYLDHLKSNFKSAEPEVTFSECLEAALYCTEVHSAADAYLIKSEAEYMFASESGDEKAEGGYWAKIKSVIKHMWEAFKTLVAKAIAYVKTIPEKLMNLCRKIGARIQSIGLKGKWEAVKGHVGANAPKDIKYLEINALSMGFKNDVIDAIDALKAEDIQSNRASAESNLNELREEVNDQKSKYWKVADSKTVEEVIKGVSDMADAADKVLAGIDRSLKSANTKADDSAKRFEALYKAKDEAGVKKVTQELSFYRHAAVLYIKASQMFATFASKSIYSKVVAAKKFVAAVSGGSDKKDDKDKK